MKFTEIMYNIGIFIIAMIVIAAIVSLPVYWLWNWLIPVLFHLPEITWIQAWGLMFLSSLLFKNWIFNKEK